MLHAVSIPPPIVSVRPRVAQVNARVQFTGDKTQPPPAENSPRRVTKILIKTVLGILFATAAAAGPPTARTMYLAATSGEGILGLGVEGPAMANSPETRARRQHFEQYIRETYLDKGDGQISWAELADLMDYIAERTPNNEAFRRDVWHLFGTRPGGPKGVFHAQLDTFNTGLPTELLNSDLSGRPLYHQEQVHHYLAGVTGSSEHVYIPTHLVNNPVTAIMNELMELGQRGRFNWGDVRLFLVSMDHRDDFLIHGRSVVGKNMRSLLKPAKASRPE